MSISAVNGTDARALFHQRRLDFRSLASAVEAGDTAAAQAALQSYQKDVQAIGSVVGSGQPNGANDLPTAIKTDLSSLALAVQSGSMADAQTALRAYAQDQAVQAGDATGIQSGSDALAKDLQSLLGTARPSGPHHHHHHHQAGQAPADGTTPVSTSGADTPSGNAGDGSAGATPASDSASGNPQSAAIVQVVKQFVDALEQLEQPTQQATV